MIGNTTTTTNATKEEIKIPISGSNTNKIKEITTPTNVKANKIMKRKYESFFKF
jgi:hypothetical protein